MAGFDFKSLATKDAQLPAPKGGGGRTAMDPKDNPFVKFLSDSHAEDKGKMVEVPKSQVVSAKGLIRKAAEHLELGARVVIQPDEKSEQFEKLGENAKVKVLFKWKVKTERKRKPKTQETEVSGSAPTAPVSSTARK